MLEYIFIILIGGLLLWFINDLTTNLPPGPTRLPLLGNLLELVIKNKKKVPYLVLKDLSLKYGPVMTLKVGTEWQILVDDKDLTRAALTDDIFVDRPISHWLMERSFGKPYGILWASGDSWKELRRFTLRTLRDFGFGKQKGQEVIMEEELRELMSGINSKIGSTEKPIPLDMHKVFTVSVLNILWSMIAGVRFSHEDPKLRNFVHSLSETLSQFSLSGGNIFYAFPLLCKIPALDRFRTQRTNFINLLHKEFRDMLTERKELGYYKEEQRDFVEVFLYEIEKQEAAKGTTNLEPADAFTVENFTTTTLDLFAAGSETTSNTLEFGLLYMILNPEIQKKVQVEIDHIVGRNRFPNVTDKPSMPYTEATMLEILRLSSVVPITGRRPIQDARIGNYTVPKGMMTTFNLYSYHHNEILWEEPFQFRPERFLDASQKVVNTDKIIPFGLGKRLCLGEVLARATFFTYFTTLLQNYTFERSPGHGELNLVPRFGLTLSPAPFHSIVKQR